MSKFLILLLLMASFQAIALDESKGIASVIYKGKVTPQLMQEAALDAKYNALERFVAQTNSAKLRIFDSRKSEIMSKIDDYILSSTVIAQNDDKGMKTFSITIRAEINNIRLQNLLNDNTGSRSGASGVMSGAEKSLVLVFIPRSQDSRKTYDDRTVKRTDTSSKGTSSNRESVNVTNSENLRSGSESISDSRSDRLDVSENSSVKIETGGSSEIKDDKIQWKVFSSNEVSAGMNQVFIEAGLETYEAEFVPGINLNAIRKDYGMGNDVSAENLRIMVSAAKSAGYGYVATGTVDVTLGGTDPQTGLKRTSVTVNGKVYQAGARVRSLGSFTTTKYGMGQTISDAQKDGMRKASEEAAARIVDQLNIQGF